MTSLAHIPPRMASKPDDVADVEIAPRPQVDTADHATESETPREPELSQSIASRTTAVRKMLALLSRPERRRLLWMLPLIIGMGFSQVIGIASITPFLAVLADPQVIQTNGTLKWLNTLLGFASLKGFLLFLGVAVLVVLTLCNAFTMGATWVLLRVNDHIRHTLARRLLVSYLHRPYLFFTHRNSSDLSKSIINEVNEVINGVLQPMMQLCAKVAVVAFALSLLVIADPLLAVIVTTALGGLYGALFVTVRRKLSILGERRVQASRQRFKVTSEALGGIKEIKLLGRESDFAGRFGRAAMELSRCKIRQQVITQLPGHGVETIAFGGILLIILLMLAVKEDLGSAVPLLGLYAFASYRLMPAFQGIFASLASIRSSSAALNVLFDDLHGQPAEEDFVDRRTLATLPLLRELELRDVSFAYPGAKAALFRGLHLKIAANSSVALVGVTGSGKSTLVDLILGLIEPDKGQILVDGAPLDSRNLASWQKQVGYVPQHIYLFDESVAQNIAFGLPPERIDMAAVEKAARLASIHDFIVNELPQGYQTLVGERGVRLSGGQRQRLGIARALYHAPAVLVLDEATSALDGATEQAVLEAIRTLSGSRTLIMIAHRLSTVQGCDEIFVLEKGQVVARGTSQQLVATSPQFRALSRRKGSGSESSQA